MLYYYVYFKTLVTQVGLAKLYCSICQCIAEIVNDFYFIFFLLSRRKHFYLSCAKLFFTKPIELAYRLFKPIEKEQFVFQSIVRKVSKYEYTE